MKVSASASYMGKEEIRKTLQNVVEDYVASGRIKNQQELEDFWATIEMASRSLRGVPYDVFSKLTTVREVREIIKDALKEMHEDSKSIELDWVEDDFEQTGENDWEKAAADFDLAAEEVEDLDLDWPKVRFMGSAPAVHRLVQWYNTRFNNNDDSSMRDLLSQIRDA